MFNGDLNESDILVLSKLGSIPPNTEFKAKGIVVKRLDQFIFDIRIELDEDKADNVTRILLDDLQ